MNTVQRISKGPLSHPLAAGVFYSLIWLALEALVLSFLMTIGSIGEDNTVRYTYVVHGIALFIGGIIAGRRSGQKGWYYGGITGFIYMLLVLLIAFLAVDAKLSFDQWMLVIAAFAWGAIGGIIGVNLKKSK